MSDSDNEDTLAIIEDFQELTVNDDFREKMKKDKKLNNMMLTLARQILQAAGTTEYSTTDGGYTGDQVFEKYKSSSAALWKGKVAKKNHTKQITTEEISDKADSYLKRRMRFEKAREQMMIECGHAPRKMITDETTGMRVYVNDIQQSLPVASSDDEEDSDDELFINKYLEGVDAEERYMLQQPSFDSD